MSSGWGRSPRGARDRDGAPTPPRSPTSPGPGPDGLGGGGGGASLPVSPAAASLGDWMERRSVEPQSPDRRGGGHAYEAETYANFDLAPKQLSRRSSASSNVEAPLLGDVGKSFSSLELPEGHIGSRPLSRRNTPQNAWNPLQNVDVSSVINQIQTRINSRAPGRAGAELDGGAELPPSPPAKDKAAAAGGGWLGLGSRTPPAQPRTRSSLVALVPMDDVRLKPRWPAWALATCTTLAALLVMLCVYLVTPKSVDVWTQRMEWGHDNLSVNETAVWYSLELTATLPVHNHNSFQARVEGEVSAFLFDMPAGTTHVETTVPPWGWENITVSIDVGSHNRTYARNILDRCSSSHKLEPQEVIFLIDAKLSTKVPMQGERKVTFNTYTLLHCDKTKNDHENFLAEPADGPAPGLTAPRQRPR